MGACKRDDGKATMNLRSLLLEFPPPPFPLTIDGFKTYFDFLMWLKGHKEHRLGVFNKAVITKLIEAIRDLEIEESGLAADALAAWVTEHSEQIERLDLAHPYLLIIFLALLLEFRQEDVQSVDQEDDAPKDSVPFRRPDVDGLARIEVPSREQLACLKCTRLTCCQCQG